MIENCMHLKHMRHRRSALHACFSIFCLDYSVSVSTSGPARYSSGGCAGRCLLAYCHRYLLPHLLIQKNEEKEYHFQHEKVTKDR